MLKEVPVHDLKVNTKLSCVRKRCESLNKPVWQYIRVPPTQTERKCVFV